MKNLKLILTILIVAIIIGQVIALFIEETKLGSVLSIISMVLIIVVLRIKSKEVYK